MPAETVACEGALLALDLGSTWLKASVFAPDGALLGGAGARQRTLVSDDGVRREQHPDDWWAIAGTLVRQLVAEGALDPARVLGVSVTGRGATPVFLDAQGTPVCPVWMDGRSADAEAEARQLARSLAVPTHSYAVRMAGRLAWLRREHADVFARVHSALHAKDFLLFRLTGERVTDPASGPDAESWPLDLFAGLRVDGAQLREVRWGWQQAGTLTPDAAEHLGLPAGLPVATGLHDGAAANVGAGAAAVGDAALTLGTHAVIRGVVAEMAPGARRFYELLPGRVCVGGNALYGGRSVDWFLDMFAAGRDDRATLLTELEAEAATTPAGCRGALFLPFLGGSVSPHVRPFARAGFVGLAIETDRRVLFRAILEGVAYALRGIRDELAGWDVRPSELRLTGGGRGSRLWQQILAAVLQRPLVPTPDFAEGRGVAVCLSVMLGCYEDVDAAVAGMVHAEVPIHPHPELMAAYDEGYERFRHVADAVYQAEVIG